MPEYKWAEEIFKAYADLINLQWKINDEHIDMLSFLKVILARGKWLLLDALEDWKSWDNLDIDSKYWLSLVKSGAFTKALFDFQKNREVMNMDDFNKESPDFQVQTFNWWELIKSGDNLDMVMEENYINPELFSIEDYRMLAWNISDTYKGVDDELIKILYKDIPRDLNTPNVKFYMMREKSKNWRKWKLLAICKMTKKEDGSIYWWTHYVEPDYRWNFGIGSYIAKLAFKDFQEYNINAIVAKNNSNLEAQVNHSDFVGTSLYIDELEWMKSDLMIGINLYRNKVFKTKDMKQFPDLKIRNNIWENNWYEVMCLDSRPWFDEEYISTLKDKFSKWYAITRIFYDRYWKEANLEKTYIVFEKIPIDSEIVENSLDLKKAA